MAKLFLFFLLIFQGLAQSELHAQIVAIPDANFKAKLIALGVDTNGDNQIQQSEALAVTSLDISNSNISSVTGVEAFTNLNTLKCIVNQITSLDVSNHPNLTYLDCSHNPLGSLDVSNHPNLTDLLCSYNQLTSLNVSNTPSLSFVECITNLLTNLDMSNCTNLHFLHCSDNQLISLDVSNDTSLTYLDLTVNQVSNLDVSTNKHLHDLHLGNNQVSSLDVSNNPNLNYLSCFFNQITSLDVSYNPILYSLDFSSNQIVNLDVSNNTNLQYLHCLGNAGLLSLKIKNGSTENINFDLCPNLQYICADANELANIQSLATQYGLTGVVINSFCSYGPMGHHNTITGQTLYDSDANGCTPLDITYPYLVVRVTEWGNLRYSCTNDMGAYTTFAGSGNSTLIPQFQNPTYFSSSPATANVDFSNANNAINNTQTQDFCITANGVFPDVEIACMNIWGSARPGFNSSYTLLIQNKGTEIAAGNISLDFMGNKMNVVSTSLAPTTQTTNQLVWAYSNLLPFEKRSINVIMDILPPPTNNIGDNLSINTAISLLNDANGYDNQMTLNETLVGSYDPNDKTCLEGKVLPTTKIGDYLHYLIRFQNTGTFYAENVVVVDTLDATKFDITSMQMLEASHPTHIDLKNNVLQFYFEGIMLPDSFANEPASHGYALFKIKTKSNLAANTTVKNKAEIYFDFNAPIITDETSTVFSNGVGISPTHPQASFQFYPNPAQATLTIETLQATHFTIFNAIGEIMLKVKVQDKQDIDMSAFPKGIYILKAEGAAEGSLFMKE